METTFPAKKKQFVQIDVKNIFNFFARVFPVNK